MRFSRRHRWASGTSRAMPVILALLLLVRVTSISGADPTLAPTIDVWYGTSQSFGQIGTPQPWVNILGSISESGGGVSLEYTLNGGDPVELTIGPDGNRLVEDGDFNVDLATADLLAGTNLVAITARRQGDENTTVVTVDYDPGTVWPATYSVDWSSLATDDDIQDVSQVVDGKWMLDGGNVRTVEPGYDRLIAMGDASWDDYEVVVPVTIHESLSSWLGVGILFRWPGHSDNPIVCDQPKCGWLPLGAICWYREGRLEIYGNDQEILGTQSRTLTEGVTYWFKARVETNEFGGLYSFKVWEYGQNEPDPGSWDVTGQDEFTDPQNGSMMLLTHRADVSFGDVFITDLEGSSDFPPIAGDDTAFVLPGGSVDIDVLANDTDIDGSVDPATVTIGSPPSHGTSSVHPVTGVVTYTHDGTATTSDAFSYTVEDDDGLVSNEATVDVSVVPEVPPPFASDDFSGCVLDSSWTFVNPLGDGTHGLAEEDGEAVLQISLPAGTPHDAWGPGGFNESARVMQPTGDVDFEIETKFGAEPTDGYNDQGILVEEDADNWLRFDVYHNGSTLKAFMGSIVDDGGSTIYLNSPIPAGTATFIRVRRIGDQWTMFLSGNGSTWDTAGSFTLALTARSVGVYAANPIDALAFTSEVDYFFNTGAPIVPEDDISAPPAPSDLTATILGDAQIDLVWTDNSGDEDGFYVERDAGSGFETIDQVDADVSSYSDVGLDCDTSYGYRVSAFNCVGISGYSNTVSAVTDSCPDVIAVDEVPDAPLLLAAQPNPFRPQTTISFFLSRSDWVTLIVFDATGRVVRELVRGELSGGIHHVTWDGRDQRGRAAAAGPYFYRMRTLRGSLTGKVVLLR